MEVTNEQNEQFPSQSERNSDSDNEKEMGEDRRDEDQVDSINNNATRTASVKGSAGARQQTRMTTGNLEKLPDTIQCEPRPGTSTGGETVQGAGKNMDIETRRSEETERNQAETMALMQNFMVEKGLINCNMTEAEIRNFILTSQDDAVVTPKRGRPLSQPQRAGMAAPVLINETNNRRSPSEATIYRRAVEVEVRPSNTSNRQRTPFLSSRDNGIDKLIAQGRASVVSRTLIPDGLRKSSSSEEFMDTSDKYDAVMMEQNLISDTEVRQPTHFETPKKTGQNGRCLTAEEQTAEVTKDAEINKANLYEVQGKELLKLPTDIIQMDQDYQMLDSHVDETLRRKIENFEYVDFSKLVAQNMNNYGEDQRLEIINRNGMTFLSPASDREQTQITTYNKWEQTFRVYSNVLTARYPNKATELLQYSHVIHTSSMAYAWDNIYAYDKEFRHHISRHPTRSWAIILQQAWTMLLKDRVHSNNNTLFNKGGQSGGRKRGEPCRHYNRGKCTYGLSCKFDHRCSVKKCGKFGHGAHICHLRHTESEDDNGSPSQKNAGVVHKKNN